MDAPPPRGVLEGLPLLVKGPLDLCKHLGVGLAGSGRCPLEERGKGRLLMPGRCGPPTLDPRPLAGPLCRPSSSSSSSSSSGGGGPLEHVLHGPLPAAGEQVGRAEERGRRRWHRCRDQDLGEHRGVIRPLDLRQDLAGHGPCIHTEGVRPRAPGQDEVDPRAPVVRPCPRLGVPARVGVLQQGALVRSPDRPTSRTQALAFLSGWRRRNRSRTGPPSSQRRSHLRSARAWNSSLSPGSQLSRSAGLMLKSVAGRGTFAAGKAPPAQQVVAAHPQRGRRPCRPPGAPLPWPAGPGRSGACTGTWTPRWPRPWQ